MKKLFVIVLLQVTAITANAGPLSNYDSMYNECLKNAGGATTGSVTACAEKTSLAAKTEINMLYQKAYGMLAKQSAADAAKLEHSQKSWVSYRNNHCELVTSYVGSPMFGFCPMQLNISRVNELRELVGQ
jgi:uncharacterized protein YecT (DUF1311 family)